MRIIEIEYGKLISSDFNNEKITVRAVVEEGENPEEVCDKLKEFVERQFGRDIKEMAKRELLEELKQRLME
ncbi:MAG: hypothetical protein LWW95_08185 [Candidatus Desulfofervidus auxilii]|nr:hypothetical protein [Candidatus Desulfofervidus auxilii]